MTGYGNCRPFLLQTVDFPIFSLLSFHVIGEYTNIIVYMNSVCHSDAYRYLPACALSPLKDF